MTTVICCRRPCAGPRSSVAAVVLEQAGADGVDRAAGLDRDSRGRGRAAGYELIGRDRQRGGCAGWRQGSRVRRRYADGAAGVVGHGHRPGDVPVPAAARAQVDLRARPPGASISGSGSAAVPPCGSSASVPGVGVGLGAGDGVGLAVARRAGRRAWRARRGRRRCRGDRRRFLARLGRRRGQAPSAPRRPPTVACVAGLGCVRLSVGRGGGARGATGGFGLADGVKCSSRPVSAKAAAAMATAATTAAALSPAPAARNAAPARRRRRRAARPPACPALGTPACRRPLPG